MFHFIKTGFWVKTSKPGVGFLNLEKLITSTIGPLPNMTAGENIEIVGTYPDFTINVVGISTGLGFTVFNLN